MPALQGSPKGLCAHMVITDLSSLQTAFRQKRKLKFLMFWGHTPKQPGMVDQSSLSQWFSAPFDIGGIRYATAEHYMMVQKALLFGNKEIADKIICSTSPGKAKALGRKVTGFDETIWRENRFRLVCTANLAKFSQHSDLRRFLLRTGSKILVEASPYDNVWGIGMAADHPYADNPLKWQGINLLGFALMSVRRQLQQQAA